MFPLAQGPGSSLSGLFQPDFQVLTLGAGGAWALQGSTSPLVPGPGVKLGSWGNPVADELRLETRREFPRVGIHRF